MEDIFKITPSAVISSTRLKLLCENYHNVLCKGEKPGCLPRIRIRYVEENGKFGYAEFGDFFFFADCLYVWREEEKYADSHNQDVVDGIFDEKCTRQGYACPFLYAGADTNYVDSNGEHLFVGDVVELKDGLMETQLALGYFPYDEQENMKYCFVLDNHILTLEDCMARPNMRITRIGTVYFQLAENYTIEDMNQKFMDFNGWNDTNEEHEEKVLMARYTPNFEQEKWKYHGLGILGAEYDWRQ